MSRLIPRPTVSGILSQKAHLDKATTDPDEAIASCKRTQASLEHHLQQLLDAQSVGLSRQIGATRASSDDTGALSRKQLQIPLQKARHEIHDTIQELAVIKEAELSRFHGQAQQVEDVLSQAVKWKQQRNGLRNEIDSLDQNEINGKINDLDEENAMVQEQINAMEEKLSQLRSHQRLINDRASELRNVKQTQLSSWESALQAVDRDINQYLRRPLAPALFAEGENNGIVSLQVQRRTLDMVVEQAQQRQSSLNVDQQALRGELEALNDGAEVWSQAVELIEDFERQLRRATIGLSANGAEADTALQNASTGVVQRPDQVLSLMVEARGSLERLLEEAEEKSWTLLIAAIGAELEAFKQGQEILETLLPNEEPLSSSQRQKSTSKDEVDDPGSLLLSHPQDHDYND